MIAILTVLFLSVATLVWALASWITRDRTLGQRLEGLNHAAPQVLNTEGGWQAKVADLATPIARLAAPQEGGDTPYLRVRFLNAGLRQPYWPALFFGSKTLLALLLPGLYLLLNGLLGSAGVTMATVLVLLLLAAVGYYLPNVVLAWRIHQRQLALRDGLPDAIDLMTVCVEAGLAIDAAMKRTCEELAMSSPELAEELRLVTLELQVGASRDSAFHNLATRTGVSDINSLVTILLQSGHFGTNVADSLRVLAGTMRENRQVQAEEKAAKVPLKLLFPMIFFIFPALFVVLLGPAMITVYRTLLPTLAGTR